MNKHPDTFIKFEDQGKIYHEYRPTYPISCLIDSFHESLASCPTREGMIDIGVGGNLRHEDALKLYELAYFCKSDMLELGTYHGLSAYILCNAVKNSGQSKRVYSVDINLECIDIAKHNLAGLQCELICAEATEAMRKLRPHKFGFIFVDHSHAYDAVYSVCQEVPRLLIPGGFVLFHDWCTPQNRDETDQDYGVHQAVNDGLNKEIFEFWGSYGLTGLFRRMEEQPQLWAESLVDEFNAALQARDTHIQDLESQIQIDQIQHPIAIQLLRRWERVVNRLFPAGTRRGDLYLLGLRGTRVILQEGWRRFFRKLRIWSLGKLCHYFQHRG